MCKYCENEESLDIISSEVKNVKARLDTNFNILDITVTDAMGESYLVEIKSLYCPMCGEKLNQ